MESRGREHEMDENNKSVEKHWKERGASLGIAEKFAKRKRESSEERERKWKGEEMFKRNNIQRIPEEVRKVQESGVEEMLRGWREEMGWKAELRKMKKEVWEEIREQLMLWRTEIEKLREHEVNWKRKREEMRECIKRLKRKVEELEEGRGKSERTDLKKKLRERGERRGERSLKIDCWRLKER